MPLEAVIAATTTTPAAILGRPDLGTLRVGGVADITVLGLDDRPADLADAQGERRAVAPMLRAVRTMAGGELYEAAEVTLELRPLLDADREVDCTVPI
jgi:dihydroorotase